MTTTAARNSIAHKPMARMASGARVAAYTLNDPEVAERMNALHARLTGSKEESIAFLKKVGIINRSGKLSKNFGG